MSPTQAVPNSQAWCQRSLVLEGSPAPGAQGLGWTQVRRDPTASPPGTWGVYTALKLLQVRYSARSTPACRSAGGGQAVPAEGPGWLVTLTDRGHGHGNIPGEGERERLFSNVLVSLMMKVGHLQTGM